MSWERRRVVFRGQKKRFLKCGTCVLLLEFENSRVKSGQREDITADKKSRCRRDQKQLTTSGLLCTTQESQGEPLQVLRYLPGQKYDAHHDYFDPELYKGQPDMQRMVEGGERPQPLPHFAAAYRVVSLLFFAVVLRRVFCSLSSVGNAEEIAKLRQNGHKMAKWPRTTLSTS